MNEIIFIIYKGMRVAAGDKWTLHPSDTYMSHLGFTRTMVYKMLNSEEVPVVKIGSRKFIQNDKFFKWLDSKEESDDMAKWYEKSVAARSRSFIVI